MHLPTVVPDVKTKTRCSGHCCKAFCLQSPERMKEEYNLPKTDTRRDPDIDTIYNMVIYLGQFPTNPLFRLKGETWTKKALILATKDEVHYPDLVMESRSGSYPTALDSTGHFYACKHIQLDGNCRIYKDRPRMCRVYPNGHDCAFADCTLSSEDQKKHAKKVWGREERKLVLDTSQQVTGVSIKRRK